MPTKSSLVGLPDIGKVQALKPLRRHPMRFTGPRDLRLQSDPQVVGGPGEPPEGFVTAHTSRTEWVWFWASAKVLKDPREFPKDVEFEALLYLPSNAVALQQGREPDQTEDFGDSVSYETFSNRAGWGASALAD